MKNITVIPGDGIGKEITEPTIDILETLDTKFDFIYKEAGAECFKKYDTNLPQDTIDQCAQSDATLFGAVTSIPQQKSAIVTLRRTLDLYANQRPIQSYKDKNIDFTIIRENSEGLYSHLEESDGKTAIAKRKITFKGSDRINRYAFEYAKKTNRSKVTASHKSNVLPKTDGVFLDSFYKISEDYPEIEANDYYIDATAMYLITRPQDFDVIVTTNLFGDILSDEAGGLLGSLGMVPSANIGDDNGLFEPVHGSAPDIANQNKANPTAMILSACLMLEFLDLKTEADEIHKAVDEVILDGKIRTPDLGGSNSTTEFATEVLHKL